MVDDGSTDATETLMQRYPGTNYIRLPNNHGVSHARNVGLEAAQGDWVALLDSDDAWLPEKLAQQVDVIRETPDCQVFHSDEIWIRDGRRVNAMRKHAKPDGWVYAPSLALCCVSPSSVLIHRSVFDTCGHFDESLPACEDYDLWLRIFSRYRVKLVDRPLVVKYGGHADQLSRKYWGMDRFRVSALLKMLESDWLEEANRLLTMQMLVQKCKILEKGARKRGQLDRARKYHALGKRYHVEERER